MDSTVQEITDIAVDVLDRMDGPDLPADAVFAVLCPRLDSPAAVLQRTAWRSGRTDIRAHGFGAADVGVLIAATHALRHTHPLMVANAAGDLAPATAQTAAGGWLSWRRSPARSSLVDLRGWDQMISLPLRGGPTEVAAFAFSRAGRDYDERELALVASVQPLLRALDRRARLVARWREQRGRTGTESRARETGLTGRELSVLLGLAEGLTAGAIAHRLGCSVRTVSKHSENIYRKLEVRDRLSAVLAAQRRGILRGPGEGDRAAPRPGPDAPGASGTGADAPAPEVPRPPISGRWGHGSRPSARHASRPPSR